MIAPGLEKLHDFQQPPPPSWMPQTTAWYVVFAIVALVAAWIAFRAGRRWVKNRYRRAALAELAVTSPQDFSALLKRTALAAWPREAVAALNGDEWLKFLDASATPNSREKWFAGAPGSQIEQIAIVGHPVLADDEQTLRKLAAQWIRRHRVPA